MTDPKNQNEIITNNDNNAVLNEQLAANSNTEIIKKESLNTIDLLISETKKTEKNNEVLEQYCSYDKDKREGHWEKNTSFVYFKCDYCKQENKADFIQNVGESLGICDRNVVGWEYHFLDERLLDGDLYAICEPCYSSKSRREKIVEYCKGRYFDKVVKGQIEIYQVRDQQKEANSQQLTKLKKDITDWGMIVKDQLEKKNTEIEETKEELELTKGKIAEYKQVGEKLVEQKLDLESKKNSLEKEKETNEAKISNLESEKLDAVNELGTIKGQKDSLETQLSNQSGELKRVKKQKEDLEAEQTTTSNKLGELDQAKANLTIKLNSRTFDLDQANQDKARLEREKRALQSQINTLNDEKQVLIDNYNEVSRDKNELVRIRREEMRRILENNTLPETKDLNINDLNFENNELKKTVISQRANITSNAVTLRELEREKATAQNALISMNDEKEQLEQELRGVEAELDDIKIDLNRADQNMTDKDEEINRLEAKIEGLESELAETKQQLSHAEIDLETANSTIEQKTRIIGELNGKIEGLEAEIERQKGLYTNLQNAETKKFNELNDKKTAEAKKLSQTIINQKDQNDRKDIEITRLNGTIKIKELEIRQITEKVKIENDAFTTANDERNKFAFEVINLKKEIEQKAKTITDLEVDKSNLNKNIDDLKQKLKDQKADLTNQINNLQTELNEIQESIDNDFYFGSKSPKDAVRRLMDKNRDLKQYEPSFVHNIGHYTGINWLSNKIGNTFTVVGFGAVASVVGPMIFKAYMAWQTGGISLAAKRRKNRDNDDCEEEPQPRRTKRVKPEPIEAEVEVIKPASIETEKVKQLPEEVMGMEQEPTEKEQKKK